MLRRRSPVRLTPELVWGQTSDSKQALGLARFDWRDERRWDLMTLEGLNVKSYENPRDAR